MIEVVLNYDAGACGEVVCVGGILAGNTERSAVQPYRVVTILSQSAQGVAVLGSWRHGTCDVFCTVAAGPCQACDCVFRFFGAAYFTVCAHVPPCLRVVIVRTVVVRGELARCA